MLYSMDGFGIVFLRRMDTFFRVIDAYMGQAGLQIYKMFFHNRIIFKINLNY